MRQWWRRQQRLRHDCRWDCRTAAGAEDSGAGWQPPFSTLGLHGMQLCRASPPFILVISKVNPIFGVEIGTMGSIIDTVCCGAAAWLACPYGGGSTQCKGPGSSLNKWRAGRHYHHKFEGENAASAVAMPPQAHRPRVARKTKQNKTQQAGWQSGLNICFMGMVPRKLACIGSTHASA